MIKAEIKKNDIVTNSAIFETHEQAETWVLQESNNGSFGRCERWLLEKDFKNESIEDAVDVRDAVQLDESTLIEYKFLADFEVSYIDVTEQLAQEETNRTALKYLADTDWLIIREVDSGIPCPQDIRDARAAARLSIV